jgi:acyl-CoA reductase-like NAD-dependent aldehyde dehydrogenase
VTAASTAAVQRLYSEVLMPEFRLTYSTMFTPPPELHEFFDRALVRVGKAENREHPLFIGGCDVFTDRKSVKRSPIDQRRILGQFQIAGEAEVNRAMRAASDAFKTWRLKPWEERIALLRKAADLIEQRVYDIAAAISLEVGKNRMEALGEAQETADFFKIYADQMQQSAGFARALPDDPVEGSPSHNRSVLKPYGVWVVVAPFNFPFALAGGPVAAALAAGNTVVMKGAVETPWAGRMLADCLRDAGLPAGVFNYLNGTGSEVGELLIQHELTGGITFTGSHDVGMRIAAAQAAKRRILPLIAEMGGRNAAIVTRRADLQCAATGIVRSAFGMQGQKCSALSRLYVDDSVADALIEAVASRMRALTIGDPTDANTWLGPVATRAAYDRYEACSRQLNGGGSRVLMGGEQLRAGELAHGYYCAPTLAESTDSHPLWNEEMFCPIVMLQRVRDREHAMSLANASTFGLTAGFYGAPEEIAWFFEHIEAGVTYANRAQGATTGAWPGYQAFGGWKGSSSTGKAIASFYYLPQYMREQSQTHIQ